MIEFDMNDVNQYIKYRKKNPIEGLFVSYQWILISDFVEWLERKKIDEESRRLPRFENV